MSAITDPTDGRGCPPWGRHQPLDHAKRTVASVDCRKAARPERPSVASINHGDCVNLDQVAGRQRHDTQKSVSRLVIPEQFNPGPLDDRQAFVAFVVDDVDVDLGDLIRAGPGGS